MKKVLLTLTILFCFGAVAMAAGPIKLTKLEVPRDAKSAERFTITVRFESDLSPEQMEEQIDGLVINYDGSRETIRHQGEYQIVGKKIMSHGVYAVGKSKSVTLHCYLKFKDGTKSNAATGVIRIAGR